MYCAPHTFKGSFAELNCPGDMYSHLKLQPDDDTRPEETTEAGIGDLTTSSPANGDLKVRDPEDSRTTGNWSVYKCDVRASGPWKPPFFVLLTAGQVTSSGPGSHHGTRKPAPEALLRTSRC